MEEPFNPYAAGEVQPQQVYVNPAAGLVVTPMALSAILGTKFWVKLIGWSMLLISILTLLGLFIGGSGVGSYGILFFVFPIAVTIAYVLMSVRLIQYGSAIKVLAVSKDSNDLTRAIELQTKFWKLAGILLIVVLVLYVLLTVVGMSIISNFR